MVEWTKEHMNFFRPTFEPSVYFHIENWRRQIPKGAPKNIAEALKSGGKSKATLNEVANAIADGFLHGQNIKRYFIVKREADGTISDQGSYSTTELQELPKKLFNKAGKLVYPQKEPDILSNFYLSQNYFDPTVTQEQIAKDIKSKVVQIKGAKTPKSATADLGEGVFMLDTKSQGGRTTLVKNFIPRLAKGLFTELDIDSLNIRPADSSLVSEMETSTSPSPSRVVQKFGTK